MKHSPGSLLKWAVVMTAIFLWASAHAQQIPRLLEVPPDLPDAQVSRLSKQRASLVKERAELRARTTEHNAKKALEGSTEEAELRREGDGLRTAMQKHITASTLFNEEIVRGEKKGKLRAAIAADEMAIRALGLSNRAEEFAEWEKLTGDVQADLEKETLGILLRLAVDEQSALVSKGVPAIAALDARGAARIIKILQEAGANDPYLAEAISALVKLSTKVSTAEEKLKAANMLVTANQGLVASVKAGTVMNSADTLKAGTEAILETAALAHSPQIRLLVGSAELTAELAFTIGQQQIVESRVEEMTKLTEDQLKQLQVLTERLKAHVRELNGLN